MPKFLCITVRFLQLFSHGRCDRNEPEWPPSPLRLFQALVASSAGHWNERVELKNAVSALQWLEILTPQEIVAEDAIPADHPYRLYVPDNVGDKVAASWSKGSDADIADYRTEKDIRPMQLSGEAIHYLYPLPNDQCPYIDIITAAARSITHLGWGIDMVVGDVRIITCNQAASLDGIRWRLASTGDNPLRVPMEGTLYDLMRKYSNFLHRLSKNEFKPIPPLKFYKVQHYQSNHALQYHPYRIFELRNPDGLLFHYPQSKLIHISGMVRHLAINKMEKSLPEGVPDNWVDTYVAGHTKPGDNNHKQFSYIPLSSIGHKYTNPSIRRVMIVAPLGDDHYLEHLARRLDGAQLEPTEESKIKEPPTLVRVRSDNVSRCYTNPANGWTSVTPVILPGHNDHKPEKTIKLIEKALAQSGIEQPCEFEWSAISRFSKSMTAHKYERDKNDPDKKITKIWLPKYLQEKTAIHLTLRFQDGIKVPGPIAIGAGRHCGLGIMANFNSKKYCREGDIGL